MPHWDTSVDFVVVGSGAGGMTAALTAHSQGASAVVLEKTERFGGTTGLSGGVIWVPNNASMQHRGLADSAEDGLAYLRHDRLDRSIDPQPLWLGGPRLVLRGPLRHGHGRPRYQATSSTDRYAARRACPPPVLALRLLPHRSHWAAMPRVRHAVRSGGVRRDRRGDGWGR